MRRPAPRAEPRRPVGDPGEPAVALQAVSRIYRSRAGLVAALDEVTLEVTVGTWMAVMGPSGSGKSTLLQVAAGLDRPTSGEVRLAGHDLRGLSEARLTRLRRERVGFVFQSFNLLPSLTAEQNVALPLALTLAVTGFVSVMVIAGTFSYAVAARRRELGLLRGVSGAQPC